MRLNPDYICVVFLPMVTTSPPKIPKKTVSILPQWQGKIRKLTRQKNPKQRKAWKQMQQKFPEITKLNWKLRIIQDHTPAVTRIDTWPFPTKAVEWANWGMSRSVITCAVTLFPPCWHNPRLRSPFCSMTVTAPLDTQSVLRKDPCRRYAYM